MTPPLPPPLPASAVPPACELRTSGSIVGCPDHDCQKNHTTSNKQGTANNTATRHGVRHRSLDGGPASSYRSSVSVPDCSPASAIPERDVIKVCNGSRGSVALSWPGCAAASWPDGGGRRTANRSRAALAASSAGEARFLRGISTSLERPNPQQLPGPGLCGQGHHGVPVEDQWAPLESRWRLTGLGTRIRRCALPSCGHGPLRTHIWK